MLTVQRRKELRQSLLRGRNLLNAIYGPDAWVKKINLREFDFSNPELCVLGQQVKATYYGSGFGRLCAQLPAKARAKGITVKLNDEDNSLDAKYYGFDTLDSHEETEYLALHWQEYITQEQARINRIPLLKSQKKSLTQDIASYNASIREAQRELRKVEEELRRG